MSKLSDSRKGSMNTYSMAGLTGLPEGNNNRQQCTVIVKKAYGVLDDHRCGFMSLPNDTLCGTHRRAADYQVVKATKTVKVADLLTLIVDLCKQLPRDNAARLQAMDYCQRRSIARDVVDEVLQTSPPGSLHVIYRPRHRLDPQEP